MREKLQQYVELLFAGAANCEDVKQEILQNTLDRYDDLIAEGKVPEAAYRLSIAGIGDLSEILGTADVPAPQPVLREQPVHQPAVSDSEKDTPAKRLMRAIAVGLYILCIIPTIALSQGGMEIIGLCLSICIAAVATVLIMLGSRSEPEADLPESNRKLTPEEQKRNHISKAIRAITIGVYLVVSVITRAWHLTWVIFPLSRAIKALVFVWISGEDPAGNRKALRRLVWSTGLVAYAILTFETGAWYITWLVFPICGAACGLLRAILDYKEAVDHET